MSALVYVCGILTAYVFVFAASIDAQINDDLTPAENAANILELILKVCLIALKLGCTP